MATRIMIISRGAGFMIYALESNLMESGFETVHAEPLVKSIEMVKENVDIVLLLADEYIYESADALVYLKDLCEDKELPVCLIGYEIEMEEVKRYIPEKFIIKEFTRPFDAKNVSEELKDVSQIAEEKKLGKHILLVDDDPTSLRMFQGWLSEKYRVTAVKSGMQAITYIAHHSPDLILLDYDMPITPGPQVMEMIRSEVSAAQIPIIFLTGKSDRESIMKVMKLKPQGYLLKTMSRKDIIASIDDFFENRKWNNKL
ncbi:response regulator [Butyrivibrio sp. MB2005]|uniref:response regulator n=1 Tax=Butyrivibrio sp. MB2005 TaxID=1280678 RepID=UPI00040C3F1A|nr:response regulator [Butyrivibrio sp. MB2005]